MSDPERRPGRRLSPALGLLAQIRARPWLGALTGFALTLALSGCQDVVGPVGADAPPMLSPSSAPAVLAGDGFYTPIDLGTLGGSSSAALAISELGHVVGTSRDAAGNQRGFLWQGGVMIDIGGRSADMVNDAGQVVLDRRMPGGPSFWSAGTTSPITGLGGSRTTVTALNNAGRVVGEARTPTGEKRAFTWHAGTTTDLGTLSGESWAADLNDAGRIAGTSVDASGFWHAVIWEGGAIRDLGVPGLDSWAEAVTESGDVYGWFDPGGDYHLFRWRDDVVTDLGAWPMGPEILFAFIIDANDAGQVLIGAEEVDAHHSRSAWVYDSGTYTQIGTPSHNVETYAETISESGQVVGLDTGPFVWDASGFTDLELLAVGTSGRARDVNEAGRIVGSTGLGGGGARATLWTFTPAMPSPCVDPALGLVSWWSGETDASDQNLSNHGVLMGDAVAGAPGIVGRGFDFDGDGDYAAVPTSPELEVTAELTLSAWILVRQHGFYPSIVGKGNLGASQESYALYLTPGGQAGFVLRHSLGRAFVEDPFGAIPLNTWTHVAGTYDGNVMVAYVNGTEASRSGSFTRAIVKVPDDLLIGKADRDGTSHPTSYLNGLVDEVQIHNRGLSAAEVLALYEAGPAGTCSVPAPPEQIEGLSGSIDNLEAGGEIDSGAASALNNKLDQASAALAGGAAQVAGRGPVRLPSAGPDIPKAIKKLGDFVHQVDQFERNGRLSPGNAAALRVGAEAIIQALQSAA